MHWSALLQQQGKGLFCIGIQILTGKPCYKSFMSEIDSIYFKYMYLYFSRENSAGYQVEVK